MWNSSSAAFSRSLVFCAAMALWTAAPAHAGKHSGDKPAEPSASAEHAGHGGPAMHGDDAVATTETPAQGAAAANGTDFKINMKAHGMHIAFDTAKVEVPFGQAISVEFRNEAPADSMISHNIVILKPDSEAGFFERLQAAGYDMAAMANDPAILTMTPSLEPGQADKIEFTPDQKAIYPYVCTMPGHGDVMGMRGEIVVL